jgi:hypothetical protein
MTTTATPTTTTTEPAATPQRRGAGRAVLVAVGALLLFVGINTLMGAALTLLFDSRHGDDGFFTARQGRFSTGTYAITSANLDMSAMGPDQLYSQDLLGRLRITVDSTSTAPIFVGIARTADVEAYLGGVAHEEIDKTDLGLFGVEYTAKSGGAPAAPPTAQTFWVASAAGQGRQTITWSVASGDWTIVVMNADGSTGVSADGTGGITLPILHTVITVSFVAGALFALPGLVMVIAGMRKRPRPAAAG